MSKALPLFAVDAAGTLADNAPLMLYARYSEMIAFAVHIHDPNNVAELHSMRIAAKRLRYTLEIFSPAFAESQTEYSNLLNEIKSCQEQIGDIHDCDVRIDQIREYLNQNIVKKPEIRIGLSNLIDKETSARKTLYSDFIKFWNALAHDRAFERKFVDIIFAARLNVGDLKSTSKTSRSKTKPTQPEQA